MNCDDLSFITTMQKTLKPSKKECFNPQDGWEKTSYPGISAERYVQKYEMQVASKKVYWKNNRVFQTLATYHHWKRWKVSDLPPSKNFSKILTPTPSTPPACHVPLQLVATWVSTSRLLATCIFLVPMVREKLVLVFDSDSLYGKLFIICDSEPLKLISGIGNIPWDTLCDTDNIEHTNG